MNETTKIRQRRRKEIVEWWKASELPKKFRPFKLTIRELERLKAWIEREGWTREKTTKEQFGPLALLGEGDSMPGNLTVPGVDPSHWSGKGKCVCVMCGYTTTVTNVCRRCREMPVDEIATHPVYCEAHETYHEFDGKPSMHRAVAMVAVS